MIIHLTLMQRIKLRLLGRCSVLFRGRSGWGDGVADLTIDLRFALNVSHYDMQKQLSSKSKIPFHLIRHTGWLDSRITIYRKSDIAHVQLKVVERYPSTRIVESKFELKHNLP